MFDTREAVGTEHYACTVFGGAPWLRDALPVVLQNVDALLKEPGVDRPAVVLVDASLLDRADQLLRLPRHVILVAADPESEDALGGRAHVTMSGVSDSVAAGRVLRAACEMATARSQAVKRWRQFAITNHELRELLRIGQSLMYEHDLEALLRKILKAGKQFTQSDGCCLFITDDREPSDSTLRLALYEFDSLPNLPDLAGRILPMDHASVVGHAAATGQPVVVPDAYHLPPDSGYTIHSSFDERFGYYRRSMLIVPLMDHLGNTVGVIAFFNRKLVASAKIDSRAAADRYVRSYGPVEVRLVQALAGQAAVSIENAKLYERIERMLESFVKAAVSAIDQRDPTTSGHSIRVATLVTDLAKAVDQSGDAAFRDVRFTREQLRELYFAALVHDFGKVSVHEDILIKAKKLPPELWERVDARFDLIHRTIELEHCRKGGSPEELASQLRELDRARGIVARTNEPTVLDEEPDPALSEIGSRTFERPDGSIGRYLTDEELHFLQVRQGTLDDRERATVRSHVEETYRFLSQIPWTDDLRRLSDFAYGHHEKLDGSGYPRHLKGDEIPLETRLITIADMFDALTEGDRPYKPSVPAEQAIRILENEAERGTIDANLVRLLADSKVYRRVVEADWRQL